MAVGTQLEEPDIALELGRLFSTEAAGNRGRSAEADIVPELGKWVLEETTGFEGRLGGSTGPVW